MVNLSKTKIIDCIECKESGLGMPIPCNEEEIKIISILNQIFNKNEIEKMQDDELENILKTINHCINIFKK